MYLLTISLLGPGNNWFKVVEWCQKGEDKLQRKPNEKECEKYEEK